MAACIAQQRRPRCAGGLRPCDRRRAPSGRRYPVAGRPAAAAEPARIAVPQAAVGRRWRSRPGRARARPEPTLPVGWVDWDGSFGLLRRCGGTMRGNGGQRKQVAVDLLTRGRRQPRRLLDTSPARQYVPGSIWHSPFRSAKGLQIRHYFVTRMSLSADEEAMAKTKFRPLHDRIVVRRITAEERSEE